MKRYFTFAMPPDPTVYLPRGYYHYMSLPAGGYVAVLDEGAEVPSDWTEIGGGLLDPTPAYFDGLQHQLGSASTQTGSTSSAQTTTTTITTPAVTATLQSAALPEGSPNVQNTSGKTPIAGISVTDTPYQVARKLATANPLFRP